MAKKDLTVEEITSIACQVLPQVLDCFSGGELIGKIISFRSSLQERLDKAMNDTPETRICSVCHNEKIIEDFYYRKSKFGGRRDLVCRRCRIKQNSKNQQAFYKFIENENQEIKQSFGSEIEVGYTEKEKEELKSIYQMRTRLTAKEQYYCDEKCYLLKKYLKRHEEQLQRCFYSKQKIEEELVTDDRIREKWTIKNSIIKLDAKIRKLQELIAQEKEQINNIKKSKGNHTHE